MFRKEEESMKRFKLIAVLSTFAFGILVAGKLDLGSLDKWGRMSFPGNEATKICHGKCG
jgi:hypothetical protein